MPAKMPLTELHSMNHSMNHRILPLICYPSVAHIERNFSSAVSKMQMKLQTVLNEPEVCYAQPGII